MPSLPTRFFLSLEFIAIKQVVRNREKRMEKSIKTFINVALEHFITAFRMEIGGECTAFYPVAFGSLSILMRLMNGKMDLSAG